MDAGWTRTCDEIEQMLTPYVDDEASAPDRLAVEEHLSRCPACDRRAQTERAGRAVVRARRAALAQVAPAALHARCQRASRPLSQVRRWVPLSLAATLVLAVAGAFLWSVNHRVNALAAQIAADHVRCFTLVDLHQVAEATETAERWQRAQGWRISVMPSVASEHIQLLGVRRCLSAEGQMAHLMYLVDGHPLSVFVWRQPDVGLRNVEVQGHKAVIWSSADRMYAVVGTQQAEQMARVAAHVRRAAE
jgi:anti-sigma factor RsiW